MARSPARDSNLPATSAAWALTSCTQIQSGLATAIQDSSPLVVAERMPLRLRLVSLNKGVSMSDAVGDQPARSGAGAPPRDPLAQEFVQFAVDCGVLRFGEFKTKAGRLSPYFFNAGCSTTVPSWGVSRNSMPAVCSTAASRSTWCSGPPTRAFRWARRLSVELARLGRNVPFAYNRKEAKDHGEGGTLVGAPLKGRVLIVDDVMSAGTAVRESIAVIQAAGATPMPW
jgi:orotate phosphoribosyltransferase